MIAQSVFELVLKDKLLEGIRLFNSRFVDEVKNKGIDKAFEKSKLVIQAYDDKEKLIVFT